MRKGFFVGNSGKELSMSSRLGRVIHDETRVDYFLITRRQLSWDVVWAEIRPYKITKSGSREGHGDRRWFQACVDQILDQHHACPGDQRIRSRRDDFKGSRFLGWPMFHDMYENLKAVVQSWIEGYGRRNL